MPQDPPPRTTTQHLADALLGDGGLDEFVATRRTEGRSWRRIALELHDVTAGKVSVAPATLYAWFGSADADKQATDDQPNGDEAVA